MNAMAFRKHGDHYPKFAAFMVTFIIHYAGKIIHSFMMDGNLKKSHFDQHQLIIMKKQTAKIKRSLIDQMHLQINNGTAKKSAMIEQTVPDDVLVYFQHLPHFKTAAPYIDGFSICIFKSKINEQ